MPDKIIYEIPYVFKNKVYDHAERILALENTPPGSGGDMYRTTYDPDQDGKIANTQLYSGTGIADAIDKKHANTLDHSNSADHDGSAQDTAIGTKTTLTVVKADTDVASAISLRHSNNLDHNGGIQDSAIAGKEPANANIQTHVTSAHAPNNAQVNADITKAEIEAKLTGEIASHTHAGGGGDGEVSVVATQDTANATINLANATGLTFNALANSTYIIEVFLLWAASAITVGIKVSATASGTPTITAGHFMTDAASGTPDSSSYNANDVVVTTSASAFTTYNCGKLNAVLKTSGNASTWQLRFAAETTGTITIKVGSTLRYRKVA